ncbi:MAG: polymerase [Candidatus Magnetoglobus multicellularis str. Araruama]|uniref:Polymerase n=1 Tax=Candidatus Magnetoglobus multicellularis str. Araruama TaxID=890399 RepID=A0A1V1PBZ8_9BACT|nr:MAG: polymerase [Candidatus Magnetoglobus multicellularis str. Araruama]
MKAYLTEKTMMDSDVTIEDIKKFLEHEKIVNGIVDDEEIQKFIDKRLNRIKPFLIAEGSEPTSPQHGRIRYFFDTQPLKKIDPNLVDEKDRIDFKERGEMPYVEKGTLIAERVPGIPGKHGKDVYGKRIEAKKAKHVTLRCGNGAILSEDKRMVHARIDGLPVTTSGRNERIDVLPHYYISGDVNMKTGNVRFNGPVIVKGTVQNGFKVRCATLEAKELFRADIRADGDILVQGGVVGTQVVCNGSFKAKFVKGSTIQSDGLVVVSNGIVDSKVDTRENCIVENNKILTSDIMALKNIETQDLGSKSSPGCQLTIGVDPILIKELTRLTDENKSLEKQLETSMEELDIDNLQELNDDYQSVVEKIDQLEPPLKEAKTINHTLIKKI